MHFHVGAHASSTDCGVVVVGDGWVSFMQAQVGQLKVVCDVIVAELGVKL